MKVLLAVVALAAAVGERLAAEQPTAFDYHGRVGVPRAERTRRAESEAAKDPSRIVGGSTVDVALHPHQCGMVVTLSNGYVSMCGCSTLTNTRLLTAAHCWWDGVHQAIHYVTVFGSNTLFSGGTRINTTAVIMHENWNPFLVVNDIAIIQIPWVDYTNNIQPIRLPSGSELTSSFAGAFAVASGYGRTSDTGVSDNPMLYHVDLQIISNDECRSIYPFVIDSSLCTASVEGRNICSGDSGGPLTVVSGGSRVLVGVSSFGPAMCMDGPASGFVRVSSYADWIHQRI